MPQGILPHTNQVYIRKKKSNKENNEGGVGEVGEERFKHTAKTYRAKSWILLGLNNFCTLLHFFWPLYLLD